MSDESAILEKAGPLFTSQTSPQPIMPQRRGPSIKRMRTIYEILPKERRVTRLHYSVDRVNISKGNQCSCRACASLLGVVNLGLWNAYEPVGLLIGISRQ